MVLILPHSNQALETQIQGLKAVQQVMQQYAIFLCISGDYLLILLWYRTTGKLKITNNNLWVWDKEILIHQSEIMELKAEKAELQALYGYTLSLSLPISNMKCLKPFQGPGCCQAHGGGYQKGQGGIFGRIPQAVCKCEFLHTQLANLKIECKKVTCAIHQGDLLEAELHKLKKDTAT